MEVALHVDFGLAGPITLDAFSIQLIGPSPSPLSPFDVPFTGIISLSGLIGPAGTVSLSGDSLFVANSTVSSSTGGAGDGGNVLVTASGPVVLEGASATRRTARPGARGGRTLASFGGVGRGGLPLLSCTGPARWVRPRNWATRPDESISWRAGRRLTAPWVTSTGR